MTCFYDLYNRDVGERMQEVRELTVDSDRREIQNVFAELHPARATRRRTRRSRVSVESLRLQGDFLFHGRGSANLCLFAGHDPAAAATATLAAHTISRDAKLV